jgi:hypothetical protein
LRRPFESIPEITDPNNTPSIVAATNNQKWFEIGDLCFSILKHDPKARPTAAELADSMKQLVEKYSTEAYKQEERANPRKSIYLII